MCVYCMVADHYGPRIPWAPDPNAQPLPAYPFPLQPFPNAPSDLEAMKKILDDFRQAIEAAKVVDKLTKQPDCEDPEKAKLEARVAELEQKLAEATQRCPYWYPEAKLQCGRLKGHPDEVHCFQHPPIKDWTPELAKELYEMK